MARKNSIFFVKDHIDKDEMKVEYCPTTIMLADYFTKPLMGNRFRELRSVVMEQKSVFYLNTRLLACWKTSQKVIGCYKNIFWLSVSFNTVLFPQE